MVTDLVEERRGLLKYILFQYHIRNKETVWVLNYLKDHPVMEYCRFSAPEEGQNGLTLTSSFQLLFNYDNMILTEPDVIFNLLNQIEQPFYLYITFRDDKINQMYEYEWLLEQMEKQQLPDEVILTARMKRQMTAMVETRIDLALIMNERSNFDYYSKLLKKLKER
ncbi:hypothetical protein ERX27_06020 [Macrococcus brunensis]|uniref:UPF0302 domain-containing protein n=1 Tax=Macrococcus brunensis TaxID=198483 RepID=A0A4R6BDR1_9STAP|nr:YpiB family protein [Macrococcus brunensis]TDL97813.1 hypothetical protein ERX27_06020 [Macrococcus brunensis]ULG71021.1 YpiB family protein [Macrococcus brunensis]ULG73358.1 YpiB family protein [Macrococcus brunensis]